MSLTYCDSRVLVTGGAGFLGSNLVHRLLELGSRVTVVDDLSTGCRVNLPQRSSAFSFLRGDIRYLSDFGGPFDYIFHLACAADVPIYQAAPIKTLETSALGTMQVLKAAERCGARLIFTSTSEIYGNPDVHPQSEDYYGNVNCVGPRSMYDEGKRFAEALLYSSDVSSITLRIFNTYGPGMRASDGRLVPKLAHQALQQRPLTIHGDGHQTRSLCYVGDTIEGLLKAGLSSESGPINIGNPLELTVLEVASAIIEATESTSGLRFVQRPLDDPDRRRPDIRLAQRLLRWDPQVPIAQGLHLYVESITSQAP